MSRRKSTKATRRTTDVQRLIADLEIRLQVASAISGALPPILSGTCISDITADKDNAIHSMNAGVVGSRARMRGRAFIQTSTSAFYERLLS